MSRLNSPSTIVVKPSNNVYTAMALISMLATLGTLIYVCFRFWSQTQLGLSF